MKVICFQQAYKILWIKTMSQKNSAPVVINNHLTYKTISILDVFHEDNIYYFYTPNDLQ